MAVDEFGLEQPGRRFHERVVERVTAPSLVVPGRTSTSISPRSIQFRSVAGLIPNIAPTARRARSFDSPRSVSRS